MDGITVKIKPTSPSRQKVAALKAQGLIECGTILLDTKTNRRTTVDCWGKVQFWENDGSGTMVAPVHWSAFSKSVPQEGSLILTCDLVNGKAEYELIEATSYAIACLTGEEYDPRYQHQYWMPVPIAPFNSFLIKNPPSA